MRSALAGVPVLASPHTSAGRPGIWSAKRIGPHGEYGKEVFVDRNFAHAIGGGELHATPRFWTVPIRTAGGFENTGIGDDMPYIETTPGAPLFAKRLNGGVKLYEGFAGTPIYAAAGIGSRIMPGWNVRRITPAGETGPLQVAPRRFAQPIGNGPARPYPTLFGRRIGPRGAEGPALPLGGVWQEIVDMPLAQKVAVGACLAVMVYLAAAKLPEPEAR